MRALNITPLRCLNNYFLLLLTFNFKRTFNKGSPHKFQDPFVLLLIFTGRWLLASPPKLSGKNRFRRVFINSPVVFLLFIGNTRKPWGKVNKSTDTKQNSPKKRKVDKLLGWGLVSKAAYFQSEITQKSWSRWCVNTLMREHVDASIFFLVSLDALAH